MPQISDSRLGDSPPAPVMKQQRTDKDILLALQGISFYGNQSLKFAHTGFHQVVKTVDIIYGLPGRGLEIGKDTNRCSGRAAGGINGHGRF